MSRVSSDDYRNGELMNGFDYDLQVWVVGGIIQDCGHPASMGPECCNARKYRGMVLKVVKASGLRIC